MVLKNFIANLPFSPAVATQVGYYTKRLSREEFTRRLGLIFLSAALLMESLVLISPPQATIAAGPNNIIFQGITSKQDLLNRYDTNDDGNGHKDLQQIFTHFGISREDLAGGIVETINSRDQDLKLWSMGRRAYNKPGEYAQPIDDSNTTVYMRPLWSWDSSNFGSNYKAVTGKTADGRYFAVLFSCGNLVINIEEEEEPEPPEGFVQHDCNAITGWAYDPNDTSKKLEVSISVKLEGETTSVKKKLTARRQAPNSPIGPGHGFSFDVPESKKSDTKRTVYSVVAFDDTGDAKNLKLASNVKFSEPCLDPPPEDPEEDSPAQGNLVKKNCRCIEGWAFDSDDLNRSVEVRIRLGLEDNSVQRSPWKYLSANRVKPATGVGGNHGFKLNIEGDDYDTWKSTDTGTTATVQIKDVESGEWLTIADNKVLNPNPCLVETPEEEPEYCPFNEELLKDDPRCLECPYNPDIWIDDPDCNEPFALIVKTKTARNITQGIDDANGTTASPGDVIEYTLTSQNLGTISETVELSESLADVLEYAEFVDAGGGDFDEDTGLVTWKSEEIGPDESISRIITVRVKDEIPATPTSVGDPESFNLIMTNIFGDERVEIEVEAPTSKQIELVVRELPNTGASTNVIVMTVTAFAALYMYLRNRQLSKELRLVRSEFNMGSA